MSEIIDRILRLNTVLDRTGLSRSTLYRRMSEGRFPRQMAISQRCAGWRESEIREWLDDPMFYRADEKPGSSQINADSVISLSQQEQSAISALPNQTGAIGCRRFRNSTPAFAN